MEGDSRGQGWGSLSPCQARAHEAMTTEGSTLSSGVGGPASVRTLGPWAEAFWDP